MASYDLLLNGEWDATESFAPDPPGVYGRVVQIPGLARNATPSFAGLTVAENGWKPMEPDRLAPIRDTRRDYFWFRRVVEIESLHPVALLRFAKAQFGLKAWLNGEVVGEHEMCFSSVRFDVTRHLRSGCNELVVRLGAHPLMVPPTVPTGSDKEKFLWTAGLYDDVSLHLCAAPCIEEVQVTPDIRAGAVRVEWTVWNRTAAPVDFRPCLIVTSREGANVAEALESTQSLAVGEARRLLHRLTIPDVRLWSPEDPFLYHILIGTGGDERRLRFGMREFRFDTITRRAYLNGRIYYLRGTNITLHRFFEDDLCGTLPWTENWARRLLVDLPRRYHWNCMRWTIGPVPERWFDLADEAGLLIEYEFPIWGWRAHWSETTVERHAAAWMADAWNHASVAWWSLCNETRHTPLVAMVARLRQRDHSQRAWNNGYNLPTGEHDPVDDHPYLNHGTLPWIREVWHRENYETSTGWKSGSYSPHPCAHATVINEYCWFWLRRDGSATLLTESTYNRYFLGATPGERRALYAEYLAGETEYFRAHRNAAGVLHFVFLTGEHPWSCTGDLFRNVTALELHPEFDAALRHAFHPLGIYLNFWHPAHRPASAVTLDATIVNDTDAAHSGNVEMAILSEAGEKLIRIDVPFTVSPNCQCTVRCEDVRLPGAGGRYVVTASARAADNIEVVSRRHFSIKLV